MKAEKLDEQIVAAHEAHDSHLLVELYRLAAEYWHKKDDKDAAGFSMTQAYVFALECSHPDAELLRNILVRAGRECPE